MFENIIKFFKNVIKKEEKKEIVNSKDAAKERLHLVLMQDRANVSTDFLELMKQEIIEVIKKYIDVDESAIDVRLTNKENDDGTNGAPALYANIPILNIKKEIKKKVEEEKKEEKEENLEEKEEKEEEKEENLEEKIDKNETNESENSEEGIDENENLEEMDEEENENENHEDKKSKEKEKVKSK